MDKEIKKVPKARKEKQSYLLEVLKDKDLVSQIALVESIRKAILLMMKDVSFNEKEHVYTKNSDGTFLQGVSTVSSIVPKEWLSAWGSKEAVKFLGFSDYEETEIATEMLETIRQCKTVEEYQAILKEAKGASRRKSKDAMADGTVGHEWLETYVKAKIRGEDLPKIPTGMLERPIKQFLEWEDKNIEYWILSEARVANPDEGYAGTLDGLAMMKTGKLAVIDYKFANHMSEDYYLQTAGYQSCLEAYGIKVDQRIIIRLPKTLQKDEYNKKEKKYYKVDNSLEVEIVASSYESDRDVFKHCLPVKSWINSLKSK